MRPLWITLALIGCQTERPSTAPEAAAASARRLNLATVPVRDGLADLGELKARFDAEGVQLSGDATVRVRAASVGRGAPAALRPVAPQAGEIGTFWAHGPADTWVIPAQHGLDLGATVHAAPAGSGPLRVAWETDGRVAVRGTFGWITTTAGDRLPITHVSAWDADGRDLPARLVADGTRFVVEVDDAGAVYPVHVDPVLTADTVRLLPGLTQRNAAGAYSVGDLNGDGFGDFVVGEPQFDGGRGKVHRFLGSATGPIADGGWEGTAGQTLGADINRLGDLNGDGRDDLRITGTGLSFVTRGDDTTPAGRFGGVGTNQAIGLGNGRLFQYYTYIFGFSQPSGNPIYNVISSLQEASPPGSLTLATVPDTTTDFRSGSRVINPFAGDLDGDVCPDVIRDGPSIIYCAGPNSMTQTLLTGPLSGRIAITVLAVGDVTGDGLDDVIIRNDRPGEPFNLMVIAGASDQSQPAAGSALTGFLHTSAAILDDLDGDGARDLALPDSSPQAAPLGTLQLYAADGRPLGTLTDDNPGISFGYRATGVDNLWGDGRTALAAIAANDEGLRVTHVFLDDIDGDGLIAADDCDDTDATIGDPFSFVDADGDGAWVPGGTAAPACPDPADRDCDDNDAASFPGATEACDGLDNNCDGRLDEGLPQLPFAIDADGDGHGDPDTRVDACLAPPGHIVFGSADCDDANASINPAAVEVCDELDNDCNGAADDGLPIVTVYADADDDGHGDPAVTGEACGPIPGFVAAGDDCDDDDATLSPSVPEVCDQIDNNCSGAADEGLPVVRLYADLDGDTVGDDLVTTDACAPYDTWVLTPGDCDDANAAISPLVAEVCDGLDNDCSGAADDGLTLTAYAPDADGDGFGDADAAALSVCSPDQLPVGVWSADRTDCDDADPAIRPTAAEVCDGIDNDCTDGADNGLPINVYYQDSDGDGVGGNSVVTSGCAQPAGYAPSQNDCNDGNAAVYPGAPESCNQADDNCNGLFDEGLPLIAHYTDGDGDGFGAGAAIQSCLAVFPARVTRDGDCDDNNAGRSPGAAEVCDGIDQDCDGTADNGVLITFYTDADGDGWGVGAAQTACSQPAATTTAFGDCDDSNNRIYPGASEIVGNSIDQDCDGSDLADTSSPDSDETDDTVPPDTDDTPDETDDTVPPDTDDTVPPDDSDDTEAPTDDKPRKKGCDTGANPVSAWWLLALLGLRRRR